ncbi:hypothetical protein WN55_06662 [Dufourea novaeangliae]|uniref:Uncharacterized protein n=1 Tax=Dufourea novaeangliae TaxID=178035 RepID=A0A154P211_DUFNO|nr:hypothetical protein WN55_06662 [Dufourea novaeangliae]
MYYNISAYQYGFSMMVVLHIVQKNHDKYCRDNFCVDGSYATSLLIVGNFER